MESDISRQTVLSLLSDDPGVDRRERIDKLMTLIYDDLRRVAEKYFREERPDHTLQPTALVHEAYVRLLGQEAVSFDGRSHFFAAAACTMRRILVDYARSRRRLRRGGGKPVIQIDDNVRARDMDFDQILALHDAIEKLATLDARQAKVVELRYFGGLEMDEIAAALDVSKRTVEGDWTHAKAWLRYEFSSQPTE